MTIYQMRSSLTHFFIIALHCAFLFCCSVVSAENLPKLETQRQVKLDADTLTLDDQFKKIEATGHVVLISDQVRLLADRLTYDTEKKIVKAIGNVSVVYSDKSITGNKIEFHIETNVIHLENIVWLVKRKTDLHASKYLYKITGARLSKNSDKSWSLTKAEYTACDCGDGEKPSWSIACDKATVYNDRSLSLKRPVFKIKQTPVLVLPSLTVPLQKRKTGFLLPSASYTGNTGATLKEEFFWVINDHNDMTFGLMGLTKKGIMPLVESRNVANNFAMKTNGFYLYDFEGDKQDVTTHRFSTKLRQQYKPFEIFSQKASLELYSDTQVVTDFGNEWRSRNTDYAGSNFELSLSKGSAYLGATVELYQNLFDPKNTDGWLWGDFYNQNVTMLPAMSFQVNMLPFLNSKLFFDLDSSVQLQYINYTTLPLNTSLSPINAKPNNVRQYGLLYGVNPSVSFPVKLGKYASIGVKAGINHFGFVDFEQSNEYSGESRINLSAFLETRVYRVFTGKNNKVKHTINPSINWNYSYEFGHGTVTKSMPTINLNDSLLPHSMKISLKQSFAIKSKKLKKILGQIDFNIHQRIAFIHGKYLLKDNYLDDSVLELNARFSKIAIKNSVGIYLPANKLSSINSRFSLGSFNGVSFNLQYLYLAKGIIGGNWIFQQRSNSDEKINQISIHPSWDISKLVSVGYVCDISFNKNELMEHAWFLKYRSRCNCWSMSMKIIHRPDMDFPDIYFDFDLAALFN